MDVTKGPEKAFKKLEQLPTLPALFTHFIRNHYKKIIQCDETEFFS